DRVWAKVRRPNRTITWRSGSLSFAAGAAFAAVIGILAVAGLHRQEGYPFVVSLDGSRQALRPGAALPRLDALSVVGLGGAGRMVVAAHTTAVLERFDPKGITLAVDRGKVLLHATRRRSDAPLLIRTPQFVAKVVGTVLRVSVEEGARSSIAVGRGVVE